MQGWGKVCKKIFQLWEIVSVTQGKGTFKFGTTCQKGGVSMAAWCVFVRKSWWQMRFCKWPNSETSFIFLNSHRDGLRSQVVQTQSPAWPFVLSLLAMVTLTLWPGMCYIGLWGCFAFGCWDAQQDRYQNFYGFPTQPWPSSMNPPGITKNAATPQIRKEKQNPHFTETEASQLLNLHLTILHQASVRLEPF